eukprot:c17923_g1_i1.p1 GENE.c17923_g1_i1~~c17923_g1_i1.p1  ORF type:complete len:411 (+),score=72.56 c17923_g1_i1:58-1290(+)
MRLDLFLCAGTQHTAKMEAIRLVREGFVTVNSVVIRNPCHQVFVPVEEVCVNGVRVPQPFHRLLVMHKPKGLVSVAPDKKSYNCPIPWISKRKRSPSESSSGSTHARPSPQDHLHGDDGIMSEAEEKSIMDLVPDHLRHSKLSIYGRLDKNTTGIILLGTDGGLGQMLLNPDKGVVKEYIATLRPPVNLDADAHEKFEKGLLLDDGYRCKPAYLSQLRYLTAPAGGNEATPGDDVQANEDKAAIVTVRVSEGGYHIVKRMIGAVGGWVAALHRVAIGNLRLDPELREGQVRHVNDEEIAAIHSTLAEDRTLPKAREKERQMKRNQPKKKRKKIEASHVPAMRTEVECLLMDKPFDVWRTQCGGSLKKIKEKLVEELSRRTGGENWSDEQRKDADAVAGKLVGKYFSKTKN